MWRAVLLLALLLPGVAHAAPSCADAARIAWPEEADLLARVAHSGDACAIRPWPAAGADIHAVTATESTMLYVALLRLPADGATPTVLARGETGAITIDPIWTPSIGIEAETPLGPRVPAIAVRLFNGYVSTARSTETQALHLFIRRGEALDPVFAGLLSAEHRERFRCRARRDAPCERGWTRTYRITAAGPARGTTPPPLVVRDARTGRVLARPHWRGMAYVPPVFDRMPVL